LKYFGSPCKRNYLGAISAVSKNATHHFAFPLLKERECKATEGIKVFFMLVALQNLGCSKNQVDGQQILGHLSSNGFTVTADFSIADIIIVNTCAFIQEATQEAIHEILEMTIYKTEGKCKTLAVAGCFSERFRNEAKKEFTEVDLWLGVDDWPQVLKKHFSVSDTPSSLRTLSQPMATQYLKIAEGCSHRCSFCAIPSIRGPFHSRPKNEIIAEAQWLQSQGVKECILVSQDTSSYGSDTGSSLVDVLLSLLDATSFPWVRLMYLHPQLVTDDFLHVVAQNPRIVPYFDIPLQHISDDILVSMKRRPLSKGIYSLIERIRAIVPDAGIRTTFIVGYPGETEKHFAELLKFVEWARFERCGIFPFSREKGTDAYSLRGRPKNNTVTSRCDELMALQSHISAQICSSRIGKSIDVIVDSQTDAGFEARSKWDAPEVDGTVFIPDGTCSVGSIQRVLVTESREYDLIANLLPD